MRLTRFEYASTRPASGWMWTYCRVCHTACCRSCRERALTSWAVEAPTMKTLLIIIVIVVLICLALGYFRRP